MKYKELRRRLAALPKVSTSFLPSVIEWVSYGRPSPTLVALIPHRDGTVTATVGDLREKVEPVLNEDGSVRVFETEDAACDWAWEHLAPSLTDTPRYAEEDTERAVQSGREQLRRAQAILDRFTHTLNAAIVAYTGYGRRKFPTVDEEAVLALSPTDGATLLGAVKEAIRRSDTIPFSVVAPFDAGLRERLQGRLHEMLPDLGPDAIEALGWRCGYLNLA